VRVGVMAFGVHGDRVVIVEGPVGYKRTWWMPEGRAGAESSARGVYGPRALVRRADAGATRWRGLVGFRWDVQIEEVAGALRD